MKRFTYFECSILFIVAFSIPPIFAGGQGDSTTTIQAMAKELEGQQKWLRIDVVRIQYGIGGKDATYVDPDGKTYYKAKVGEGLSAFRDTQSTSAEDFADEASKKIKDGEVRVWHKGRKVEIHEVKLGRDQIQIGITDEGGAKAAIKFMFEKKNYTMEDFKKALTVAFANSESEIPVKIRNAPLISDGDFKKALTDSFANSESEIPVKIRNTPLMSAAYNGDIAEVRKLIKEGADVNETNVEGQTALMSATRQNQVEVVKVLVENGADVNSKAQGSIEVTALMIAARFGYDDIMKILIDNGADVNARSDGARASGADGGYTALMRAARNGQTKAVKILIDNHANINLKNKGGVSALWHAAAHNHSDIVDMLLANGADPNDIKSLTK
ncbi:hypothetical protein DCC62_27540 [candidate division KSB1 bacterium]|nr:MAG: hypothetical protein DCC62_27540 [candidate division KSB1 bacterium]